MRPDYLNSNEWMVQEKGVDSALLIFDCNFVCVRYTYLCDLEFLVKIHLYQINPYLYTCSYKFLETSSIWLFKAPKYGSK